MSVSVLLLAFTVKAGQAYCMPRVCVWRQTWQRSLCLLFWLRVCMLHFRSGLTSWLTVVSLSDEHDSLYNIDAIEEDPWAFQTLKIWCVTKYYYYFSICFQVLTIFVKIACYVGNGVWGWHGSDSRRRFDPHRRRLWFSYSFYLPSTCRGGNCFWTHHHGWRRNR